MKELAFKWPVWELPLFATTRLVRAFGERMPDGYVKPLHLAGATFALNFGRDRAKSGSPTLTLDTANGDIVPDTTGQVVFLFRPARLTALDADTTYVCDLMATMNSETWLFARGQIATLGKVVTP